MLIGSDTVQDVRLVTWKDRSRIKYSTVCMDLTFLGEIMVQVNECTASGTSPVKLQPLWDFTSQSNTHGPRHKECKVCFNHINVNGSLDLITGAFILSENNQGFIPWMRYTFDLIWYSSGYPFVGLKLADLPSECCDCVNYSSNICFSGNTWNCLKF